MGREMGSFVEILGGGRVGVQHMPVSPNFYQNGAESKPESTFHAKKKLEEIFWNLVKPT